MNVNLLFCEHISTRQVEGFGLNYADVMARHGLYREAPPMPSIIGYEVVGKVIACDESSPLLGKRVVAFTRFGGYAEKAVMPEIAAVEIDQDVPLGEALALATQYVTAYHAAYEMGNVLAGDKVLISYKISKVKKLSIF